MIKNYLTYPCKVMNITQGYKGNYSHGAHTTGTPKDYPWDEACEGTGRSPMYCPCDEMEIKRIYTKGTNTIWLESTTEVDLADDTRDFITLMVTHPNDSDIKRLKEGQKLKRGALICYEGTDGNATGNHFHFAIGKGKIKGNGWVQNTKGAWVLTTTNDAKTPESMFFIDPKFTTLTKKTQGLKFKELPSEKAPATKKKSITAIANEVLAGKWGNGEERKKKLKDAGYDPDKVQAKVNEIISKKNAANKSFKTYRVKITTAILNVRAGAGLGFKVKTTVKQGEVYTIVDEKNGWGKLKSGAGWIKLSYTKKV